MDELTTLKSLKDKGIDLIYGYDVFPVGFTTKIFNGISYRITEDEYNLICKTPINIWEKL